MREFLIIWIALSTCAVGTAQTCDSAELAVSATNSARSELLKTRIDSDKVWDDVPPEISKRITAFKAGLPSVVDAVMACVSDGGRTVEPGPLEERLANLLEANKPEVPFQQGPASTDGIYGADLKVRVNRPANAPQLLAFEVSFGINCGEDTVLMVYEKKGARWDRVLLWQSPPYDSIGKAFGDMFEYAVLPAGELSVDQWQIVVAHGHPWCSSRWSGFDLDLLRPSEKDHPQTVVWHLNRGYIRGDFNNRIKATTDGFELRVEVGTIESSKMTRPGILRYRVEAKQVVREQPIAYNGRDFVDEWLQSDWDDVKRWIDSDRIDELEKNHTQFGKRYSDEKNIATYEYGPVTACSDPRHYQVEIDSNRGSPSFYQIRAEQNGFTMLSVAAAPNARCKGANLMSDK